MELFLEDVKRRKTFAAGLTGLTVLALALGTSIPLAFAKLAENVPLLAPVLGPKSRVRRWRTGMT
jgi:hypothetical protein